LWTDAKQELWRSVAPKHDFGEGPGCAWDCQFGGGG